MRNEYNLQSFANSDSSCSAAVLLACVWLLTPPPPPPPPPESVSDDEDEDDEGVEVTNKHRQKISRIMPCLCI